MEFMMSRAIEIIKFMGEAGARFQRSELEDIIYYVEKMLVDKRVISVSYQDQIVGYGFFSLCSDIDPFYKKKPWDYSPHEKSGEIAYFEKLVCVTWNKNLRKLFEEEILKINPNAKYACWHRWGKKADRKVFYTRREKCLKDSK